MRMIICGPTRAILAEHGLDSPEEVESSPWEGRVDPMQQLLEARQGTVTPRAVPEVPPAECHHPDTAATIVKAAAKGLPESEVRRLEKGQP